MCEPSSVVEEEMVRLAEEPQKSSILTLPGESVDDQLIVSEVPITQLVLAVGSLKVIVGSVLSVMREKVTSS